MKTDSWLVRHPRLALLSDAFVFSAAGFALLGGVQLALEGVITAVPVWVEATIGLLATATTLVGPIVTWFLHARRPTWAAVIGGAIGIGAIGVVVPSLALIGMAIGWALSPFTSNELAGPIAMLVVAGAAFVTALGITAFEVIGSLRLRTVTRLTIARMVALGALLVYAIGSWWFAVGSDDPERGEPLIFAIVWGLAGAIIVLGADVAAGWWQRRRSRASRPSV